MASMSQRRWQFGLFALIATVSFFALVLGGWFYYRPLTTSVVIRFAVVDRAAAEATITSHPPNSIHGSPYQWLVLDEANLDKLRQFDGKPTELFGDGKSHIGTDWPKSDSAFVETYHVVRPKTVQLGPNHFAKLHESAEFVGYVGSRIAGTEKQLHVEGNMRCEHPNLDAMAKADDSNGGKTVLKAKITYEGQLPAGHLVFLAPIDQSTSSAIIIDAE